MSVEKIDPRREPGASDNSDEVNVAPAPVRDLFFVADRYLTPKGRLIVSLLGEAITKREGIALGVDGALYRYQNGCYVPDGEVVGRALVRQVLGPQWDAGHGSDVVTWLKATEPTITGKSDAEVLNVSNGLLAWRSGRLFDHKPEHLSTVQLPVSWHPDAQCPKIQAFLEQVLPDAVPLFYEIVGYTLLPINPFRKAILLLGPGGNGKTVALNTIRALVGENNYSAVSLQSFSESRFASAELFGKLANIAGDLDSRAIRRSDAFKTLTGNDPVTAEKKYAQPFIFVNHATMIFSANEPPAFHDQTRAIFDRFIVIEMPKRIAERDQDPKLLSKLTTPDELSGLLVRSVTALRGLMRRGAFSNPPSVKAAGERFREAIDTVGTFVEERAVLGSSERTPRPVLFAEYIRWAEGSRRVPVTAIRFNECMRTNLDLDERTIRGVRTWVGIGLKFGG